MEGSGKSAYLLLMRPFVLCVLLIGMADSAFAMNWEGHDDDWHKDLSFAKKFRDAVGAPPLERPLPSCDLKIDNVYDQVRIAGKNCIDDQKPSEKGTKPPQ
jgi:hypothetical protein